MATVETEEKSPIGSASNTAEPNVAEPQKQYASGFKLTIIVISLCLSLFLCGLVRFESPIYFKT